MNWHAEALKPVVLPDGYEWGDWSGTYRIIKRDGREITRVGGCAALVNSNGMQNETLYQIAKAESHIARYS